jgi:hypothetical protein
MAVDHRDLVTASVSEYLDAMPGLIMVQTADSSFDILRVEKFHRII